MKKVIFFIAVIMMAGCARNRCGITELTFTSMVNAIDSVSNMAEDPNNPGTFYKGYDTIHIQIRYVYDRRGFMNTKYKIVGKSETVYKPLRN